MLKKNIIYNTILQISQLIFPLITFPYAARVLEPNAIGAVNFASYFTQYFLTFAFLGIPVYGIREIAKVSDNPILLKKTFSELFYFNCITTTIVSGIFLIIVRIISSLNSDLLLFYIGFAILWSNLFFIEWYYNGIQEFKYITLRSVIIRSISVILIFTLIKSPTDKATYYSIELFVISLSAIINFMKAKHLLVFNLNQLNIRKHLKPIVTLFSLSVMISIYVYANSIILGFFKPKQEVAYYTVSEKISKLAIAFIKTGGVVLIPELSKLFGINNNQNRTRAIELLNKSFYYTAFLSIPISFGVFIYSRVLINLIAGKNYYSATISLMILSPLPILLGLAFVYSRQILFPLGKEKQMFKLSIWGMACNLIINLILIPKFGYIGASISYLFTEILMVTLVYIESRKYIKLNIKLKDPLICIILSSLFIPIHYFIGRFNPNMTINLILGIMLCASCYMFFQLKVFKNQIATEIYNYIVFRAMKIKL